MSEYLCNNCREEKGCEEHEDSEFFRGYDAHDDEFIDDICVYCGKGFNDIEAESRVSEAYFELRKETPQN